MALGQEPPPPRGWGGVPLGALILVAVGVVLLLQTTGAVSWELWGTLWRFWPVIIIALGLNMLLGRRAPWLAGLLVAALLLVALGVALVLTSGSASTVVTDLAEPLGELRSLDAHVSFGPGSLKVTALPPASPSLVEGRFETPGRAARATLRRSGAAAELRLSPERRPWLGGSVGARWELALARAPRLSIELDAGASDIQLDLRDLQVTSLDIDAGAASLDLTVPASAGHVRVEINAGAADVSVTIPAGIAARVSRSAGLSSFDIDTVRFPRSDGAYTSPGFESARDRVDIRLRVGAASVKVR